MAVEFLDTNLIIRYLTQDNPEQAERAYRILQQLEAGTLTVTTSEAIIIEAVQILSSKALYNLPRQDIRTHLTTIIALRGLKLPNKRVYLRALDLYVSTNLDFIDALNVAHMERAKIDTILSFDRDFDHIKGIIRREP
ncbi:MAG: PIN domain-containing protein [Chloroflexi bacterium]|nr:PIN domain-containing protein [Chloroflexota bacterium]